MLVTTTSTFAGRGAEKYLGLASGEAILGANAFRDLFAGIRDKIGGRTSSYEKVLRRARDQALEGMIEETTSLGANAIVDIDLDYETVQVQDGGSMLMVKVAGTTVVVS